MWFYINIDSGLCLLSAGPRYNLSSLCVVSVNRVILVLSRELLICLLLTRDNTQTGIHPSSTFLSTRLMPGCPWGFTVAPRTNTLSLHPARTNHSTPNQVSLGQIKQSQVEILQAVVQFKRNQKLKDCYIIRLLHNDFFMLWLCYFSTFMETVGVTFSSNSYIFLDVPRSQGNGFTSTKLCTKHFFQKCFQMISMWFSVQCCCSEYISYLLTSRAPFFP